MSTARRVALVTGAGRGLGAEICRALANDGWAVAVNDLTEPAAASVAAAIRADGGTAEAFGADVTDEVAVTDMVARITDTLGVVTALVANASGPQPPILVEDLLWADVLRHLEFFAKSPLLLTQAVLPSMKAAGTGRIVHIGSDLFERGDAGWSGYMAGKGAMLGLTRGWARELGIHGITVNLVAPGWIPVERHGALSPDVESEWRAQQGVQRMGVPADVAAAVAFLASDRAGFITGERLAVNGGHHLG
ncbi:SDR family oxidoreductase [Mycetocola sp. 2940]|uniref:SDR family oxidoreductase n=1 Tax=Mycetocola sp. 2940 TaxID=3156452 RepID=UPI00339175D9